MEYSTSNKKITKNQEDRRCIKVAYYLPYYRAVLVGLIWNIERRYCYYNCKCYWRYLKHNTVSSKIEVLSLVNKAKKKQQMKEQNVYQISGLHVR
jgi:hypothetical protein